MTAVFSFTSHAAVLLLATSICRAQVAAGLGGDEQAAEQELRTAIALTRQGQFEQAIPHFHRIQGRVSKTFSVDFNLALCYLGTRQYDSALLTLANLHGNPQQSAAIENLRAQVYIRTHQEKEALESFQKAVVLTPADEKLYVFVSDACLDEGEYDLGLRVINAGLRNLPNSPRLFYQRGLFRLRLDGVYAANQDFERAHELSPDSEIGYIAAAQQALASADMDGAIRTAREAIRKGHEHYMLLTILGEALLRSGATPANSAEFQEAQAALEKAVSERPGYSSAQLALGKVYLLKNRLPEAISHLELSRQLDPANPAVYAVLARAYERSDDRDRARKMLALMEQLNQQQAERIASASGGHSGIATSSAVQNEKHAAPPR
ncbi:MAG: tetratricopeptide repeat protein [Acidobacteriaceae bacterium]|nr:tetratricopeptide repeat protein [Acidobacteriaceae bacterium]MBV9781389.1 tetratricopeptide repeat protein [Acidobacteriaceae bacterium]